MAETFRKARERLEAADKELADKLRQITKGKANGPR
jgi:hypothetical protein